ncbi:cytochrome b/b6 domain-containing protein [Magnetovibrio sp.]|uniref:cytochrome b/b6 domain-containing protein n=1 Tax=Magnetovibrio sp. TaxID=2024836 RepID=UPI002F924A94
MTDDAKTPGRNVKVWDLPTRIFHWTLVAMVLIGFLTGWVFPENTMGLHLWAGYITVILLVFRLTWGLFGSEYSRLETFTFSPVHILEHMKELITLRPVKHYIGHNPTGSLMVFGLLFVLTVITLSGLMVLGGEENQGPLAGAANYIIGDIAKTIHTGFVILLLAMIVLHIAGVFVEIKLTGENLVRAMITGLKNVPKDTPALQHRKARPLAAAIVIFVFVGLAGSMLWAFSTMPPSGLLYLPPNDTYESECGDCHKPFHPSLLPIDSWTKMMAGLDDHFGEDATIGQDSVIEITAYLTRYGGENWDTEAANRFRNVNPEAPLQITETPYWKRKHEDVKPEYFKLKKVGVKSNCGACHTDHYSGRFDDQKIKIPKEN